VRSYFFIHIINIFIDFLLMAAASIPVPRPQDATTHVGKKSTVIFVVVIAVDV
jgi:hypothetical protein